MPNTSLNVSCVFTHESLDNQSNLSNIKTILMKLRFAQEICLLSLYSFFLFECINTEKFYPLVTHKCPTAVAGQDKRARRLELIF